MNKYILGSILIGSTLLACSSSDDPNSISIFGLISGFNSLDIESSKRLTVVTNQERFEEEWRRLLPDDPFSPDFDTRTVVISEMGTQTGTGVAFIGVTSVVPGRNFTEVTVTSFIPGEGCEEDAALSTPFDVSSFESRQPIIFTERVERVEC